jgi:hypothetical protein
MFRVGTPFPADTALFVSHDLPRSGQASMGPKRNPQKYSGLLVYPSPLSEYIPAVHDRPYCYQVYLISV